MNTLVVIEGTLHGQAEMKSTSTGKQLATLEIAVPNGYGKAAKEPSIFKVTAWAELAELAGNLPPDTKLTIYGRLTSRTYQWQGATKTATEIVANSIDVRQDARQASTPAARQHSAPIADEDIPF